MGEPSRQVVKSYLAKRGYVLVKSQWDAMTLEQCRKECTVAPFSPVDYGEPPAKFPVYRECGKKMYLPKFYGISKFGVPDEVRIPEGDDIQLEFDGTLRPHQVEPVEIVMRSFTETGGGILSVGCGWGKTIAACYIIAQLKKKTFVLVHKEFLMNQWIERIQGVLPGARIGRVQGPKAEIEDKDIVIGMVQSVAMKEYPLKFFDSFGFLILDEAHRIPSKEFSKSFTKIQCPKMLALSATPERNDGLTKVLKWFIGDMVYEKKSQIETQSIMRRVMFRSRDRQYQAEIVSGYGQVNRAAMLNQLANFVPRILCIVKLLVEYVREEGRQILVLSDRRELLRDIEVRMREESLSCGYYVGGMKQVELEESASRSVILATYPMAAEGLDIATIDTIVLATPKTQVEQAIGRIRPQPGRETERKQPLILDIVDDFSVFSSQSHQRKRLYRKKGYVIEQATWDADAEGAGGDGDGDDAEEGEELGEWREEYRPRGQGGRAQPADVEETAPHAGFSLDDLL